MTGRCGNEPSMLWEVEGGTQMLWEKFNKKKTKFNVLASISLKAKNVETSTGHFL